MTTPNLQLPEVPEAIEGASDEINAGFLRLDAIVQLAVISQALTIPPLAPLQGDRYIVPVGALGVWLTRARSIAFRIPTGWIYIQPRPGWRARVLDEDADYLYDGTAWVLDPGGGGSLPDLDASTLLGRGSAAGTGEAEQVTLGSGLAMAGTVLSAAPSPVGQPASGARAYRNANQTIPDTTLTAVLWPVEDYDTDAYHSTVTNTSRFTVPLAGKYEVGATVKWDSNTAGTRAVYVVVNGVTGTRRAGVLNPASAGLVQSVSTVLDLAANDYVEFYVQQDSGAGRDVASSEQITQGYISRVGVTAAPTQIRGATWVRSDGEIGVPVNDVYVRVPIAATIVGVTVTTIGGPGTCVIDIRKDSYANFPPNAGDSICAAAKPGISAASKYEDTTLTGWTTALAAGDVLAFSLESSSNFRAIFVQLHIKESAA